MRTAPCLHCFRPVDQPTDPRKRKQFCGDKCQAAGPTNVERFDAKDFATPKLRPTRHTNACIAAIYRGVKGCSCGALPPTPTHKPEAA